jgi:hypothetical protein
MRTTQQQQQYSHPRWFFYSYIILAACKNSTTLVAFQISTTPPSSTSFLRSNNRRCIYNWCDNHYWNHHHRHLHFYTHARSNNDENDYPSDNNENDVTSTDLHTLRHRMYPLKVAMLEQMYQRSLPISTTTMSLKDSRNNNNSHSKQHPIPFIEFCLHCLLHNDVPYPDSGIRFLLRVSTGAWKEQIYQSVGYNGAIPKKKDRKRSVISSSSFQNTGDVAIPIDDYCDDEEDIVTAISATISQRQNQFGILVGEGEPYRICFPSEPLEYEISEPIRMENPNATHHSDVPPQQSTSNTTTTTIWIECQLRHYDTNELFVMMGWQLRAVQRHISSSQGSSANDNVIQDYQIDRVDWQDFREMFRPGIGREEWIRICG